MKENMQIKIFMVIIVLLGLFMLYAEIVLLPSLVEFSVVQYPEIAHLAPRVKFVVMICSLPFFIVLIQTLYLCKYILSDLIYTNKPLRSLNIISIASLSIFVLFIFILILFLSNDYFTPLLGVILFLVILSSFIIAIFSKILYILVKNATILKVDNDLTI